MKKAYDVAVCGVMAAVLVAVQYALGTLPGIELVSVSLAAFCSVFGAGRGALTAVAFSLLRCLIFGFSPSAIILYLIYYPAFSAAFGLLPKRLMPKKLCAALLFALSFASAALGAAGLPVSKLYAARVSVMLYLLCGIFAALFVFCIFFGESEKNALLLNAAVLASLATVMFTLLDDVITPLVYGYSKEAAAAYFYGGFLAMIPQTVCVAISVFALFLPLRKAFLLAKKFER